MTGYTICVGIESTKQPHKHDILLQNTVFLVFCNGIYDLRGYWVNTTVKQTRYSISKHIVLAFYNEIYDFFEYWIGLKRHINTIFYRKTQFLYRFAMEYMMCVGMYWVESTATQTRYSIKKHLFSVLRRDIRFVWVLTPLNSHRNTIFQFKKPFLIVLL